MSFRVFSLNGENFFNFFSRLVCETGVQGISMVVDGTLSGVAEVRETMKLHRIPYFNFDFSIQSVVKLLKVYLNRQNALDVVLIFQDDAAVDEAFHAFVGKSPMRVILLNQLAPNAFERLKTLRPEPNYFSIIADTAEMEQLFQGVRHNPPLKSKT